MPQQTKFFTDVSYLTLQNDINAFLTANPTFVVEAMTMLPDQTGYAVIIAYSF